MRQDDFNGGAAALGCCLIAGFAAGLVACLIITLLL